MDFMNKFHPEKNLIKEFNYWVVLVREEQVTLGSAIIALRRQALSLAELKSEEAAELPLIFSWYEQQCKNLYGADKTNYIAAMMRDNFVHFHAFPRYGRVVNKYGLIWEDSQWPRLVDFSDFLYDEAILSQIRADMQIAN